MADRQNANEWTVAKTFEENGVAVRVEVLESFNPSFNPRYSLKVGRVRDGKFAPFLPIRLESQGKVTIHRVHEVVAKLLTEAEDWIHNEAQVRENDRMEYRIAKETKQANQGKQVTRVTGKTQKNRDKRRGVAAA